MKKSKILIPRSERLKQAKELLAKEGFTISQKLSEKSQAVFNRFPLLFTLLATFGLVATLYGFEKIMDNLGLSENPYILLVFGVATLIFTGSLYRKLSD